MSFGWLLEEPNFTSAQDRLYGPISVEDDPNDPTLVGVSGSDLERHQPPRERSGGR